MEYIILALIAGMSISISSISSKINKLTNMLPNNLKSVKHKFPPLKELIGKYVDIEVDDELTLIFGNKTKGILKKFNDKWLVLETKNKKNKTELYYYRISDILSINIIKS